MLSEEIRFTQCGASMKYFQSLVDGLSVLVICHAATKTTRQILCTSDYICVPSVFSDLAKRLVYVLSVLLLPPDVIWYPVH
jgi:hypothetical protein